MKTFVFPCVRADAGGSSVMVKLRTRYRLKSYDAASSSFCDCWLSGSQAQFVETVLPTRLQLFKGQSALQKLGARLVRLSSVRGPIAEIAGCRFGTDGQIKWVAAKGVASTGQRIL
jgi:hypothetical protein